jgi:hypothetical protein
MKAYCDNVIVSGSARGDLPPEEMAATRRLLAADRDGRLELVTSRFTRDEQGRARLSSVRFQLDRDWPNWALVESETRLCGFHTASNQCGGFTAAPMMNEIVDDSLFASLRTVLPDADSRHLMYAVYNGCDYFITLDTKDILPNRVALERTCGGLRIMRPSELASLL